jgi:FkbM family methyltransferase
VGANIGSISCVASFFVGQRGHVYSIEPHPETYKFLEHNISINKQKNISALNIALGAEISTAWIYDKPNIGRGAASLIPPGNANEKSRKQVYVTTIDILIETKQLPVPAVIKIDVEGFELQVLRGAEKLLRSMKAPMLCVEYSTLLPQFGGDTREIYTFIKSVNNYSCYKLTHSKEIPSELVKISDEKQLPRHDNIFCFLEDE